MGEAIRVRCPCCGQLPTLDNLGKVMLEMPPEVRMYIQRFGGKVAVQQKAVYKKKGRGSAPGKMEYFDITEKSPAEVQQVVEVFRRRAKEFLEASSSGPGNQEPAGGV